MFFHHDNIFQQNMPLEVFLFLKRNKLDLKIVYFLNFKMLLSLAHWRKLIFARFHILFHSRKLVTKITKKVFAKTNLVKVFKTTPSFYKQSKI